MEFCGKGNKFLNNRKALEAMGLTFSLKPVLYFISVLIELTVISFV
jgi:hypothetical protein